MPKKPGRIIRLDITEQHDPEWFQTWVAISRDLRKAIEYVGQKNPTKVNLAIRQMIQGLLLKGKQWDTLIASLIEILAALCQGSIEVTQASIGQMFGLLVNESSEIQAAAIDAFREIASCQGNIFPADVHELLKQLLCRSESDTRLLQSLFDYYRYVEITDIDSAMVVYNALAAWEQSIKGVNSGSLKKNCVDALQQVSSKFVPLQTRAKSILWGYCYHTDKYIRKESIESWSGWSRRYLTEYSEECLVLATVHYYRDFAEQTRDMNGIREPFEYLLKVTRPAFASHLKELMQVVKNQDVRLAANKRNFANLLALKEYYDEAAELYEDYAASLGQEPRFDEAKRHWSLHIEINRAAAALTREQPDVSKRHLEAAVKYVEDHAKTIQGTNLRTAQQRVKEEYQLVWQQVKLRERWVRALQDFTLSSVNKTIKELSDIEKEYDRLFGEEINEIHEIDEPIIDSIKQLISSTRSVLEWLSAKRNADAAASRFMDAAQSGFDIAIESAKDAAYPLYFERLSEKARAVEAIKRAADVSNFIKAIGTVPVPLIFKYHVRDRWGGLRKGRERFLLSLKLEPEPPSNPVSALQNREPIVAEVETLVDGRKPDEEITVQAGMMYGVQFTLRMPHWPEEYDHLRFFAFTTSPLLGQLPQPEILKPVRFSGSITCQTHLIFQNPLSTNAPAINVKFSANFIDRDGQKLKINLFGDTHLTLRVIERQQSTSQTINVSHSPGVVFGDYATVNQRTGTAEEQDKK